MNLQAQEVQHALLLQLVRKQFSFYFYISCCSTLEDQKVNLLSKIGKQDWTWNMSLWTIFISCLLLLKMIYKQINTTYFSSFLALAVNSVIALNKSCSFSHISYGNELLSSSHCSVLLPTCVPGVCTVRAGCSPPPGRRPGAKSDTAPKYLTPYSNIWGKTQ